VNTRGLWRNASLKHTAADMLCVSVCWPLASYLLFLPSEVFSVLVLVAFRFPAVPRILASARPAFG
jgi:hypothetical protein